MNEHAHVTGRRKHTCISRCSSSNMSKKISSLWKATNPNIREETTTTIIYIERGTWHNETDKRRVPWPIPCSSCAGAEWTPLGLLRSPQSGDRWGNCAPHSAPSNEPAWCSVRGWPDELHFLETIEHVTEIAATWVRRGGRQNIEQPFLQHWHMIERRASMKWTL